MIYTTIGHNTCQFPLKTNILYIAHIMYVDNDIET